MSALVIAKKVSKHYAKRGEGRLHLFVLPCIHFARDDNRNTHMHVFVAKLRFFTHVGKMLRSAVVFSYKR